MARVLLIEPNRTLRKFIAGILADLGHDVQQCRDLRDCRDLLQRTPFDVVATDLLLDAKTASVPADAGKTHVLTLSGQALAACVESGDRPLHERPFRFDDLQNLASAVATLTAAGLAA
ncbi:MAG: response regulator [Alphaproteobacteria bacterium]|nr:response regulator [Alphaproteobacteria bacterium]